MALLIRWVCSLNDECLSSHRPRLLPSQTVACLGYRAIAGIGLLPFIGRKVNTRTLRHSMAISYYQVHSSPPGLVLAPSSSYYSHCSYQRSTSCPIPVASDAQKWLRRPSQRRQARSRDCEGGAEGDRIPGGGAHRWHPFADTDNL